MKTKSLPSQEYLKKLFDFDEDSGHLIWRISKGSVCSGKRAGTLMTNGYIYVAIDGHTYREHRLIWKYVTGHDPNLNGELDHKNHIRNDNRFSNLQDKNKSKNQHNRLRNKNNSSGKAGVYLDKRYNKWIVQIIVNGKKIHLGYFFNLEDAIITRKTAELKYYGELCSS